jgi:ABC-type uncharacterized transport system permease subunit
MCGPIARFSLVLTWLAFGMVIPNAEAAGNNAMPLILLPLLFSTLLPLHAVPGWFQPIAAYQPFAPATETPRGLLLGTGCGDNWFLGGFPARPAGSPALPPNRTHPLDRRSHSAKGTGEFTR